MTTVATGNVRDRVDRAVRPGLWAPDDLMRLVALDIVALGMILISAVQSSGADDIRGALAWINLAVAGVLVAGAANGTWLLRGRRMVGLGRMVLLPPPAAPVGDVQEHRHDAADGLMAEDGSPYYHRSGCAFIADRAVRPLPRGDHERAGRSACGICEP